jgi:hypothetical protein
MESKAVGIVMFAAVKTDRELAHANATVTYFVTRMTPVQRGMTCAWVLLLVTSGQETYLAALPLTGVALWLHLHTHRAGLSLPATTN